jgi:small subunit ribosomal protein S8
MVNDPIGDLLIQIKNASMAGKQGIEVPHSRMKFEVAKILSEEGYVGTVEKIGNAPKHAIRIAMRYKGTVSAITDVKRMSKPGLRVYVGRTMIPMVVGGMGIAIISTPEGVMTGKTAKKKGIGGELLCTIW